MIVLDNGISSYMIIDYVGLYRKKDDGRNTVMNITADARAPPRP